MSLPIQSERSKDGTRAESGSGMGMHSSEVRVKKKASNTDPAICRTSSREAVGQYT